MPKQLIIGVVGGAGFIGKILLRVLHGEGHEVRVGDIAEYAGNHAAYVRSDVRDFDQMRAFAKGVDVLYNLAAEHKDDVRPLEKYEQVNTGGARVLCEAAKAEGVRRIVFTSSVAVYGLPDGPVDEESECRPFNEYGRTKLSAEGVYRAWAKEDPRRSLVIVRPTVVFGEGNRGNVYNLVRQIASRHFVMVGSGLNRKSMAYVENVARFLAHVLRFQEGVRTFNYADGPDYDMNTLACLLRSRFGRGVGVGVRLPYPVGLVGGYAFDAVAKLTGISLPISSVRVRKFCASTEIVAERAHTSGFAAPFTLACGIDRFLEQEFKVETRSSDNTPASAAA